MYFYIKAIHIIFVVTWFAGLFYIVRLYIYNTEAGDRPETEREVLRGQFNIMIRRLWLGITWPSAALTLVFGTWMALLWNALPAWLVIKICLVAGLYAYHLSLHKIYKDQQKGIFKHSSNRLRIWNEVATIFLVAIVMLVVVKQELSLVWGLLGLAAFIVLLMAAIRIYKALRG